MTLDLAGARAGAEQGRRQPALRDRRGRDPAHDRGAPERRARGSRWCSARSASASPRARAAATTGCRSVLAQLACEVRVAARDPAHACSTRCRTSTRCWSAWRTAIGGAVACAARARRRRVRAPAQDARRLACLLWALGGERSREQVREALRRARPPGRRARRAALAGGLPRAARRRSSCERRGRISRARAGEDQPRPVRRAAARGDGRHELVSVMQSISLADELTLERRRATRRRDEVVCPGLPGAPDENLAARALGAFRAATGWDGAAAAPEIASGSPSPPGSAAARPTPRRRCGWRGRPRGSATSSCCCELAVALGADVPAQIAPGRWLATGAGEQLAGAARSAALARRARAALGRASSRRPRSTPRADQLGARAPGRRTRARPRRARAGARARRAAAAGRELLHNDLQQAALSLLPGDRRGARRDRRRRRRAGARQRVGPDRARPVRPCQRRRARAARAAELSDRDPPPLAASSVGAVFGAVAALSTARPCVTITAWHATK